MHDTAVGTANFTGCVPAPTDEGSRSPATEGRRTRSQPMACNGVHQSSAVGFPGIRTSERSPDAQRTGCQAGLRYDSFQQLSLGDPAGRQETFEPQIGPGVKAGAWRLVRPQSA